ncbi:hypothetical protein [Bacillus toyonensis]
MAQDNVKRRKDNITNDMWVHHTQISAMKVNLDYEGYKWQTFIFLLIA